MITPAELLAVTTAPNSYWTGMAGPTMALHAVTAKRRSEQHRLYSTGRRLQLLEDDWKDLLLQRMEEIYQSAVVRASLPSLITTEHNVFKRICTELSTLYRYGVTRELRDAKQEEIARELWDEVQMDERLEKANLYTNGLRDLLIAPIVVDGKMSLWIILPDRTVVVQHPDDPTQAIAFMTERVLQNTPGYITIQRVYADAEKWVLGSTQQSGVREIYHGCGRLPAVVVHASQRVDSFWGAMETEDLFDATMSVGADMVKLNRVLKFQTELQPTFNGKPSKLARGLNIGGEGMWAAEGQFGVLDLQADPEKLIKTINARIGWIAESYGLAADVYDLSANASSGFQTRMKRLPLLEARQRQEKIWRRVEKELALLMAIVSQQSHPTLKLDPMAVDFKSLFFHDEPGLVEPSVQNTIWQGRIDLGLMSRVDAYMVEHPDLTRSEAMTEIKRVLAEENELNDLMANRNQARGITPTGEAATPQQNGATAQEPDDGAAEGDPVPPPAATRVAEG